MGGEKNLSPRQVGMLGAASSWQPLHASPGTGQVVKRYLYVDSALAPVVAGGLKVSIPDPYSQVSKITLKEALVPRTDQLLYVLLGLRCNSDMRPSVVQLGSDPGTARAQNSNTLSQSPAAYSVTKVTPHLPVFATLAVASAQSIAQLNSATLDVQYAYIDHHNDEICSYTFQPPLTTLHTVELQLYKPPQAATSYDLPAYDTDVYKITFAGPLSVPAGTDVTSRLVSDQLPSSSDFTATVLTIDPSSAAVALVGNISSLAAFQTFVARTGQDGVTQSERSLYTADSTNALVGLVTSPASVTSLATTVLLLFEITCHV